MSGLFNAYFDESHEQFRAMCRRFTKEEITPFAYEWEEAETFPIELYKKAAEAGVLAPGWPEEYGGGGGDVFHSIIAGEELTRGGSTGTVVGLNTHVIALPPIKNLGTEEQKQRFITPVLTGEKKAIFRYLQDIPSAVAYDPIPFVAKAFENIAMAKVSTSCEEARDMAYLRRTDSIVINPDHHIATAKRMGLGLAASGYTPPRQTRIKLPGASGRAAIELFLLQMHQGGYATDHDVTIGKKLGHVLTGGDIPANAWVSEQDLLDLEREAFLSLCGEEKTLARIQHMLQTNKPLRN